MPEMATPAEPGGQHSKPRPKTATRSTSNFRDETRQSYRTRSIRSIEDVNGNVDAFLQELEVKRRQLDEQIHRYVKQKEREFKVYERDLRNTFRDAADGRSGNPLAARDADGVDGATDGVTSPTKATAGRDPARDCSSNPRSPRTESDTRAFQSAHDRESAFSGLFTPDYLRLVDRSAEERSPSAPPTLGETARITLPDRGPLNRANSEPIAIGTPAEIPRITLEHRTSSSGTEGNRTLVSALRNTTDRDRLPTRKRVSLVVGDEVVAPSDNVPGRQATLLEGDAPGVDPTTSREESGQAVDDHEEANGTADVTTSPVELTAHHELAEAAPLLVQNRGGLSAALAVERLSASPQTASNTAPTETQNDTAPFAMDGEETHVDLDEDTETDLETPNVSPPLSPTSIREIPRPRSGSNTTDPSSSRLRNSSSSSSQPTAPGYSRPSVHEDPHLLYDGDLTTPEIERNQDYGSFARSSSFFDRGGSFRSGSLGESFMQKNAEDMEKRRNSSTQVRA